MSIEFNSVKSSQYKLPGGPYEDMKWTTPLVTFIPQGTKFIVEIIAQIPNGLTPIINGPTLSKGTFDTGLGKGKYLHIIDIEFPHRASYEPPNLYFFTIEYEIENSTANEDHGVYVKYVVIEGKDKGRPFPDPELERGTVTTSGIPNP